MFVQRKFVASKRSAKLARVLDQCVFAQEDVVVKGINQSVVGLTGRSTEINASLIERSALLRKRLV